MSVVLLTFANGARKQNIAYLFKTLRNGLCLQISRQILRILGQSQPNTGNHYKLYIFTLSFENGLFSFSLIVSIHFYDYHFTIPAMFMLYML